MTGDMPMITDSTHSHSTYGLGNLATPLSTLAGTTLNTAPVWQNFIAPAPAQQAVFPPGPHHRFNAELAAQAANIKPKEKPVMTSTPRRLVQVFIADPDENVPLAKSLLYSGEQKLTDATDQELFFEIDMKAILDLHNAARAEIVNKKVKERTEYLEPVKIRELKMVVVNVATF